MFASLAIRLFCVCATVCRGRRGDCKMGQTQSCHPPCGASHRWMEAQQARNNISSCLLGLSSCGFQLVHSCLEVTGASWSRGRRACSAPSLFSPGSLLLSDKWLGRDEVRNLLSIHYFWWDDNYPSSLFSLLMLFPVIFWKHNFSSC